MVPTSPADALGAHVESARDLLVEVIRARHENAADAHDAAKTRYGLVFGGQWRDLLDDTRDAFKDRGFSVHKLIPAGYKLPIVNGSLLFVWRIPVGVEAVANFASSTTRRNGFLSPQPDPTLFGPSFDDGGDSPRDAIEQAELERLIQSAGETMPVVLVMVHSSPRQLVSISWAVAEHVAGKVQLSGEETIWESELGAEAAEANVESFDTGLPVVPTIEVQKQDQPSDA